jgi:hypothetical protein
MERMMMKKLGLSGLLLASIVLTGCGGGTTPYKETSGTTPYKKTTGFSQVNSAQYENAARATPKEGSVVQSNINNTPGLGIDTTKATLKFKQVAGGQDVSLTSNDSVFSESSTHEGALITANVYEKSLTNGDFYVVGGVYSYGNNESDYLSYGLWAYAPSNSGTAEIGFYTDGGDPFTATNIAGLTGTATYSEEGGALAFYNSGSDVDIGVGDVALTANFDTDKISGDITNIRFTYMGMYNGLNVALQEADIDSSKEGGFWTGDTLTTNTDNNNQYVGKWGGQFYGNGNASDKPEFLAGTFGGAAKAGTDAIGAFVGAFVAEKD